MFPTKSFKQNFESSLASHRQLSQQPSVDEKALTQKKEKRTVDAFVGDVIKPLRKEFTKETGLEEFHKLLLYSDSSSCEKLSHEVEGHKEEVKLTTAHFSEPSIDHSVGTREKILAVLQVLTKEYGERGREFLALTKEGITFFPIGFLRGSVSLSNNFHYGVASGKHAIDLVLKTAVLSRIADEEQKSLKKEVCSALKVRVAKREPSHLSAKQRKFATSDPNALDFIIQLVFELEDKTKKEALVFVPMDRDLKRINSTVSDIVCSIEKYSKDAFLKKKPVANVVVNVIDIYHPFEMISNKKIETFFHCAVQDLIQTEDVAAIKKMNLHEACALVPHLEKTVRFLFNYDEKTLRSFYRFIEGEEGKDREIFLAHALTKLYNCAVHKMNRNIKRDQTKKTTNLDSCSRDASRHCIQNIGRAFSQCELPSIFGQGYYDSIVSPYEKLVDLCLEQFIDNCFKSGFAVELTRLKKQTGFDLEGFMKKAACNIERFILLFLAKEGVVNIPQIHEISQTFQLVHNEEQEKNLLKLIKHAERFALTPVKFSVKRALRALPTDSDQPFIKRLEELHPLTSNEFYQTLREQTHLFLASKMQLLGLTDKEKIKEAKQKNPFFEIEMKYLLKNWFLEEVGLIIVDSLMETLVSKDVNFREQEHVFKFFVEKYFTEVFERVYMLSTYI